MAGQAMLRAVAIFPNQWSWPHNRIGNRGRAGHRSVFFFQAEDGIRDRNVTGVQTCALPIWISSISPRERSSRPRRCLRDQTIADCGLRIADLAGTAVAAVTASVLLDRQDSQIGRASCRERVEMGVGGG